MEKTFGAAAVLLALLAAGCGPSAEDEALAQAIEACDGNVPALASGDGVSLEGTTTAEVLVGLRLDVASIRRAASRSAQAARLDPMWNALAQSFSTRADAASEIVRLWEDYGGGDWQGGYINEYGALLVGGDYDVLANARGALDATEPVLRAECRKTGVVIPS